jgi:RNA polymerase sigma factor (sigma-70 family)
LPDFCHPFAIILKTSVLNNMKSVKTRNGSLKGFFEWNYLRLKNYVKGQLGGSRYEAEAEDILQDVALNLFARLDFDNGVENVAAYIYRSLRNRITDIRRKRKNEFPVSGFINEEGDDLFMMIPDDAPMEAILEGLDEHPPTDLETALAYLKPEERELIIENSLNGRTFAELSAAWGISQGTLLARKHRALNKLHKILKSQNNE